VTALRARIDGSTLGVLVVPGILAGAAGLVVVVAAARTATDFRDPRTAIAFCIAIALGELVRITLPGDRESAPLGAALATAYAVLPDWGMGGTRHSVAQVVTVTAIAVTVGVFPHVVAGRVVLLDSVARRILTVALAATLVRVPAVEDLLTRPRDERWVAALVLVVVVAVTFAVDAVLSAAARTGREPAPFASVLRNELRAGTAIGSAIAATGVLIALAATVMGIAAIPVFAVPLLLAQFSFRRYATIRATYLQTIRSLSKVTEVGGYTERGHALRVARLAVSVGTDLGMSDADLLDLEYAALMHDLGQLSLADPIPGGATVVAAPEEQIRIARHGADVIRQAGVLDDVAEIVARQAEAYRSSAPSSPSAPAPVPLASRIIRAVNAYDDLVGDAVEASRRVDAIERLRLGVHDYDPRVVQSLARVLARG
jgi:HD-GYP domain-containing protein (c-di-GMP phosphodiesterase class II)